MAADVAERPASEPTTVDEHDVTLAELNQSEGLVAKFAAQRIDPEAQERHAGCPLFVLDPQHDPQALVALEAYARAARKAGFFPLADDLDAWTHRLREQERGRILSRLDAHPDVDDLERGE